LYEARIIYWKDQFLEEKEFKKHRNNIAMIE
jgi:hypothetical protein